MSTWLSHFLQTLQTICIDIMPILAILIFFQVAIIRKPIPHPSRTLIGFIYVILGIAFFLEGLEMALFPIGELMAQQLTDPVFLGITENQELRWQDYYWVYTFAASIGFATTLAEPSLIAVATKAEAISGGGIRALPLRIAVSLGVAFGIALGTFRIITGTELYFYILVGYSIVIIQTAFAPKLIIGLAYDSGGVTTSTVTVPLITALGLGLATTVPGRNPLLDGFGLIAFASLFPVIAVLAYAQISQCHSRKHVSKN